jgi:hypothetical protein
MSGIAEFIRVLSARGLLLANILFKPSFMLYALSKPPVAAYLAPASLSIVSALVSKVPWSCVLGKAFVAVGLTLKEGMNTL